MGNGKPAASWTIEALREAYRSGETTPEAVIEAIVEQAERDTGMNIWIAPPDRERIRPYLERLSELDPEEAPLWGIPFAVKDNIDLAGVPTTAACPSFAYEPAAHAPVVARLIGAGAIPVGKTNLDQFATGLVGTRSPYGETHNALRPELISGGSSSGSAVAVARGQAAFALGTDTAGSGRVPAALQGLVGWKPSLGAWPTLGVVPACASLDCITVFAHSLADARLVDGIARGPHAEDPWSRDVAAFTVSGSALSGESADGDVSDFVAIGGAKAGGSIRPANTAKILLPSADPEFYGPFASEYRAAWRSTVEKLDRLGAPIHRVDTALFAEAAAILYDGPWVAERWAALGEFIEEHPGAAFPVTERILRTGASKEHDAASVFRAMHKLQRLKLEARGLLEGAALLLPTCGGTWTREEVLRDPVGTNRDMGRYTNHCNLLDLCAVALPAYEAATELPFGVTLFALAENESLLWELGARWTGETTVSDGRLETDPAPDTDPAEPALAELASPSPGMTHVAVCGLHMQGYPLEAQMNACGARFLRRMRSAPSYQLLRLPTVPPKPGMVKRQTGGSAIELEVWEMPLASFGGFAAGIPAPLGIGKVELEDGTEVPGFICEGYAAHLNGAEDITATGGWRMASPLPIFETKER
ncbi:allophanate hydrolase [Paenibacillus sp. LHD-117]|uniref:allophanate hydrolase n=1 Tax=Paenibacillus sp. LHD-117 TaxID=3071412 RepID=UPI0027DFED07|nr:allophanate hydrolase [Paenibacillus sp. LHD-117]MDQ6422815.1 allophanate hydrolase [Paenibacillus sp. LHD-117]